VCRLRGLRKRTPHRAPDWRPDAATLNRVGISPLLGPEPTPRPEEESPVVKRGGSIRRSGVCVSVSALRATTTPTHPAISLVRHRVRFASTSAALRSNAPAAMKIELQKLPSVASASIQGKSPCFAPVFPLCLPPASIYPFLPIGSGEGHPPLKRAPNPAQTNHPTTCPCFPTTSLICSNPF